ncbi:hypothetical protein F5Y17DRAFT_359122 [Xylariaceae sp. FL0594]|nr:hypothetical protein F5Y17DRAFT_359122 [Xylariaceae sp. FL0594]
MAAAFIDAIGIISGALGIIQFGMDNLPKQDSVGSTVRITVGLDFDNGLSNAGGDLPDIHLFNEVGDFLGKVTDPGKVDDGGFGDVMVKHKGNAGDQAAYTLFSANDDAICIASATITWPSGDKYGWVGDWGRQCGGSWYFSNIYVGATQVKPDCLWIDANGDQPQTGFQVHWPEFSNRNESKIPDLPADQADRINYLCTAGPPFTMHSQPDVDPQDITHWPPTSSRRSHERDITPMTSYGPPRSPHSAKYRRGVRSNNNHPHYRRGNGTSPSVRDMIPVSLVVGDNDKHKAEDLCGSATSYGPDFANVASGTFCRMSDKTVWPVCSASVADNCFNTDAQQLVVNGVAARDEPYKKVIDWTSGQ